jgi:hypothetical protein
MHLPPPVLAQGATTIYYKLARLQTLTEWWHWLALAGIVLAVAAFVVWMYRKDSVELPRGLAVLLVGLRLAAFVGILFFFFGLEKRAERKIVKNSRAILLVDTSQSMGLRDSDSSNVPAASSRVEHVAAELADGKLVDQLREKHDVIAYRFDQDENPVEIAAFPRKPPPGAAAEEQLSEADRLSHIAEEPRRLVYVAAGVLAVSLLSGLVSWWLARRARKARATNIYAARAARPGEGESPASWALLVSMTALIAAAVILATACLRGSEAGVLAVLGIGKPQVDSESQRSAAQKDKEVAAVPVVDWTAQLSPRGVETRIGDNLKYIVDKERGGPIAAVVLFTDGGNNAGIDYKIAANAAADSLIPVYTVGLGSDKRPSNLRIVDLEAPERVYPGDKFTLTGYVQAQNYKSTSVTVELLSAPADGGSGANQDEREDEQTIDVGRTGAVVPIKFELKPEEQGLRQYKLRVRPFEGEIDRRDNEKTAKVEIIDRRTKVLLMAGGPMRDFIFLRNQLFRDKEVISDVWLQSGKPGISQEAHELLYKFPETADALFEYDAIVAFDPDWDQLDEQQIKLLERWVGEKAGGLIIVTGPVYTPQWSSRRRGDPRIDTLKALYPVVFYYQGAATLSLGRFGSEKAWPLQFTRDGQEAEFLWLGEDAADSERAWSQFEGVCGYYAVKDFKSGARVYARFGDPETAIDNVQPIYMAGQFYGSGRTFFMASGEMWRLRAVDDAYFEQFYTKLIRWAAEGRLLRDSSRGVLLVDKDRAALGEQIAVRAILQDAQHQPLVMNQVQAMLVQPDSTRLPLTLKAVKDEGRGGIYTEQFTALQEGDYRIELQHPMAAEQFLTREVRIKIPAKETESPERNDAVLREIADKTSGKYFVGMPAAVMDDGTGHAALAAAIKPQDQVNVLPGTPDRAFERQLMSWLLGIICGVLCLEWLLRRLSKLA